MSTLYTAKLGFVNGSSATTFTVFTVPTGHRYVVLEMHATQGTAPNHFQATLYGSWNAWDRAGDPTGGWAQWQGFVVFNEGESLTLNVIQGTCRLVAFGWDLLTP